MKYKWEWGRIYQTGVNQLTLGKLASFRGTVLISCVPEYIIRIKGTRVSDANGLLCLWCSNYSSGYSKMDTSENNST